MGWKYRLEGVNFPLLRRVYSRFGQELRPHSGRLTLAALAALGVALMTLARPWPLKIVIDNVLIPKNSSFSRGVLDVFRDIDAFTIVILAAAATLLFAVIRGALNYSGEILSKTVGHKLIAEVRLSMFSHIQRLPQSYHDYRETGELMTRLTGDMNLLQELLVDTAISLISQALIILGMLGVMFWIDWRLALVGLVILPAFLIAAFNYSGKIQHSSRKQREKFGKMVATVQESLAGISQVKGFAREKHREKEVGKSLGRDLNANLRTTKLSAGYARTVEVITATGSAIALLVGAKFAIDGDISPGDLIVFLSYLRAVYRPVQSVARQTTKISKALVRAEKILDVFEMTPEVLDKPDAKSASDVVGEFRFSDVSFAYEFGKPTLQNVALTIPGGRTTLLMGPTGAGKSTVAKLLLRLYAPQTGVITLDGRPIDDYRIRSLRKRITPMTQETFLFRATIAENIAFGKNAATAEEIEAAAKKAGASKFIEGLPDGYDTFVGEGGVTLSGGQRQLVSFARAALRDTPIMIFDEPATGLDVETERGSLDALRALKNGRTLIIITHHLNFLELADHVVVIDNGMAVEEGTPAELRSRQGSLSRFLKQGRDNLNEITTAIGK